MRDAQDRPSGLSGGRQRPLFGRVAIIGLGLMGGSLGLALRTGDAAGPLAREVVGYDSAPGVAQRAVARGALDVPAESLAEAVTAADLVVIATPTLAAERTLREVASHLAPDVVVTDLCSVKAPLVAVASQTLRQPERFVGGHPMAGRERAGIEAAAADLYCGARWALTPTPQTAPDALRQLRALVEALGAEPLELDAVAHDAAVAGVSHLPLTLAVALTQTLAEADDWPTMAQLAAGGYRDTTRVAAGDPVMGRDILLANREALLARLDAFAEALARLREAIAQGDATQIEATLGAAQTMRQAWEASRQQPGVERKSRVP
ncbi:MAG TPA: prephenate dehydrogenase/arogenate dehydrogenase family protein [Ktedonobacterales bacterium]|nr:prephenate dehydrogenase/arogenate dehydrogenase family protein [Ktedonobacterales bacterium]